MNEPAASRSLLWGICFLADVGNALSEASACLVGSVVMALARGTPVADAGMMVGANHRIVVEDIGHKMGHRPKRNCCEPSVIQPVPGHEAAFPVGSGRCGGTLG